MNICESLTATAAKFPDRVALIFQDRRWTYAELDKLSVAAATVLGECGVQSGDRVALVLPNAPSFVVWYYAALRVGAIAVSVSTRLTDSEVEFILTDCGAKVAVGIESPTGEASAAKTTNLAKLVTTSLHGESFSVVSDVDESTQPLTAFESVPNGKTTTWYDADPNEPALILYTSGTTGFAKGATLSHLNVRSNVHAFNHLCDMRNEDRILLAVPLFHCFGQNALLNSALNVGATLVLQEKFDLQESVQLIDDHQVTQLYGVPMMFQLWHERCNPADLKSVRYCFSAATTLPPQTAENWRKKFGMPIHEGYGLTETSPFASYNHRDAFEPGSIGTPIDNVEMRIVNLETSEPAQPETVGEIVIRGTNVMLGYWNRPDETAAAIRDGWFHSGDIGRVDERGYFYIVDRVKDMIAVGGLKVFPAEVERVLLEHPSVVEAAIVGTPDPVFGEQVVAFVVLDDDITGEDSSAILLDVEQFVRQHLGSYKRPRQIHCLKMLPRNPSGKILKTELREWAKSPDSPDSSDISIVASAAMEATDTSSAANGSGGEFGVQKDVDGLMQQLSESFPAQKQAVATRFLQSLVHRLGRLDESPAAEARFLDLGLDSLLLVELANALRSEIGTDHELPATLVFDYPSIADLAEFLVSLETGYVESASTDKPKRNLELEQVQEMTDEEAYMALQRELDAEL